MGHSSHAAGRPKTRHLDDKHDRKQVPGQNNLPVVLLVELLIIAIQAEHVLLASTTLIGVEAFPADVPYNIMKALLFW